MFLYQNSFLIYNGYRGDLMKNNSFEQQIDNYINDNIFKSVLLINGKWGSGKSHFIKRYFEKNKKLRSIYIDLDGTRSISGIQKLINMGFVAKNEEDEELSKGLVNIDDVRASFNVFGVRLDVKDSLDSLINAVGKKRIANEKCVLIFDNIEKTTCNPKDIFNLISDYLRSSIKIIVLANPNDFNSEYRTLLNDFISKNIVKEIRFLPNYQEAAFDILQHEKPLLKNIVNNNKESILNFANIFNKTNIKTFMFFVKKTQTIIDNMDRIYDEFLDKVIVYCYYTCVYFLDINKMVYWGDDCLFSDVIFKSNDNGKNIQIMCDGFKFVDDVVVNGVVDKDDINATMKEYKKYTSLIKDDVLCKFDKWWLKDDNTLTEAYKKLQNKLKNNEYHLSTYPKIINNISSLVDIGLFKKNQYDRIAKTMISNIEKGRSDIVYNWNICQTSSPTLIKLANALYIQNNKNKYEFVNSSLNDKKWGYAIFNFYANFDTKKDFLWIVDIKKLIKRMDNCFDSENIFYLNKIINLDFSEKNANKTDVVKVDKLDAIYNKLSNISEDKIDNIQKHNIKILISSIQDIMNKS